MATISPQAGFLPDIGAHDQAFVVIEPAILTLRLFQLVALSPLAITDLAAIFTGHRPPSLPVRNASAEILATLGRVHPRRGYG
jgi:hypothetical protein